MSTLAAEARRLSLASALNRHALGCAGDVPAGADEEALHGIARELGDGIEAFEQRHHVRFEPAYPGSLVESPPAGTAARLLLACAALGADGVRVGAVFTTLIAGRRPSVSVAPPDALVH